MDIPYTLDPVLGENFYNRKELLERLKNPEYRSRSLVISARRMGKTSLLREFERQITDETKHVAIYINLQLIQDDLPRLFIIQCRKQAIYFQQRGFNVAAFEGEKDFFKLLGALNNAMHNDEYLFLLVDEAGKMVNYESSFCEQLLGSFDMYSKIKWILTDSQPIYRVDETCGDFLREFAPYICLPRLDKESTIELIRQSKRTPPVEVDDALAEEIYQKTGGHPYLLQMLCFHLYKDGRLNKITDASFNNAYKECNDSKIFSEAYRLLKPIEKQLFLHLSEIHEVGLRQLAYRWGTYEETLKIALKELVQLGYVKQEGESYLPVDDFWSKWVNDNRSVLLKDEVGIDSTPPQTVESKKKEEEDKLENDKPMKEKPSPEKLMLARVGILLLGFGSIIGLITLLMRLIPSWESLYVIPLVVAAGAIVLGAMGVLKSEQVKQILTGSLAGGKKKNDEEEKESVSSE